MAERDLLLSPGIRMEPVMTLVDFEDNIVRGVGNNGDVSDRFLVQGSYIRRDSTAEIDGSAAFTFSDVEGFDFGRHMLQAAVVVHDTWGTEPPQSYLMGRWVMQPPDIGLDASEAITINCLDAVSLLSTRLDRVYSVSPGRNIADAIVGLLRLHGVVGLDALYEEDGETPLQIPYELATYGNWNITDNITYLQIANQLAEAAAHVGIFATRDGNLASYPWTPLERKTPLWDFDYEAEYGSNIVPPTRRLGQSEQVPNVWVGVATPVDQTGAGTADVPALELREGEGSPYSIEAQGGRRNPRILQLKVGSVEELTRALAQLREEDITRTERVEIRCGPLPNLWQAPVVSVNIPELGLINRTGIAREWHFPFDYASETATYIVDLAPEGFGNP